MGWKVGIPAEVCPSLDGRCVEDPDGVEEERGAARTAQAEEAPDAVARAHAVAVRGEGAAASVQPSPATHAIFF